MASYPAEPVEEAAKPKPRTRKAAVETLFSKLSAKFLPEQVKQREGGGGKKLDYISIDTVLNRLNEVLEFEWEFHGQSTHLSPTVVTVKGQEKDGYLAVVTGHLVVHTSEGPRWTFGVGAHRDVDPDMAIKSALAEAEKKAAQRRGVGLYLWDEDAREELKEQRQAIKRKQADPTKLDLDELKLAVYEKAVEQGLEEHSAEGLAEWYSVDVGDLQDEATLLELLER